MIYLHYKDTKTFGHSFFFPLVFRALGTNCLQVGNFSKDIQHAAVNADTTQVAV